MYVFGLGRRVLRRGEWMRGECVGGLDQGLEVWCYVCVSCESGFSV